jgi:hypothetical protein
MVSQADGRVGAEPNSRKGTMGWSSIYYTHYTPKGQKQSERRHGSTIEYQAIPSLRGSLLRMGVYISYITAARNSISSQLG